MLSQRVFVFEYIFVLYFGLQIFFPYQFTTFSTLAIFSLLSLIKYKFEGFRIPYLFILFSQLVLLVTTHGYAFLPLGALLFFIIGYFPVYKYPEPTGPYKVGYKKIELPDSQNVAVFYPTNETTKDVKYSPSSENWERFADVTRLFSMMKKKSPMPKFIFKYTFHYLEHHYLGVNEDATIIKLDNKDNNKGFPVIIFSHGLSANVNMYSIQLKEWASNGFIVFSVDHEEQIYLSLKAFQDYMEIRKSQLIYRKQTIIKVLDFVYNNLFIKKLFGNQEIFINRQKVFLAGHSFGGATVSEVSVHDKRVTGGLVLLDPWFEPCNERIYNEEISKPLLSIRSNQYDKMKITRDFTMKHAETNIKNGSGLSGFFKDTNHNASTDLRILMYREMALLSSKKERDDVRSQIIYQTQLIKAFLKVVLEHDESSEAENEEQTIKSKVLKVYREDMKRHGIKDVLQVDE